jgi:MYXO-CTERM domain-containing protein
MEPAADSGAPAVTPDAGTVAPSTEHDAAALAAASVVDSDTGCACHVTNTRPGVPGWLLLVGLPFLRRRRRAAFDRRTGLTDT